VDKVNYLLTRKAVKNMNLRIRPDGTVAVSAPRSIPRHVIDAFVESRRTWIEEAQKRVVSRALPPWVPENIVDGRAVSYLGKPLILHMEAAKSARVVFLSTEIVLYTKVPENKEACARHFRSGWEKRCREVFMPILESQAKRLPQAVPAYTLKIRDMKSRWGSCNIKKSIITLSSRLLQYPESCITYVALHELLHFFYPNHGPGFHRALDHMWPEWKRERERLKEGFFIG